MRKLLSSIFTATVRTLVKLLLKSCTITIHGADRYIAHAKEHPCLIAFWHNRIILAPYLLNKIAPDIQYCALVSNNRDANLLAQVVNSYPNGHTIRIAKGSKPLALMRAIRVIKSTWTIVITPDGPRGPRYQAKGGALVIAKVKKAYVFPLSWSADRYWQFNSWDHFRIPKPFARITCSFGEPIAPGTLDTSDDDKLTKIMCDLDEDTAHKTP